MTAQLRLLNNFVPFVGDVVSEIVTPETIVEDDRGNRTTVPARTKVLLKGIMQKADALNQNGRIYPLSVLEREIRNYQKFIMENRALGETDHPESSVVSLQNVSHIVREAYMDGNDVRGTIELLNTPNGMILQSLVDSKVKLGISSRGVGTTQKKGEYQVVQDDYQIVCFDIVSEPSTSGAFMIPEGRVVRTEDLRKVFNRSDRIDRILNEILFNKR